jgi:acyl carrier protein
MRSLSANDVRQFLLTKYAADIKALGFIPDDLSDDFDFFLSGVVDSFGLLEMVAAVEDAFQVQSDLSSLDAENISILGPLSKCIAANATRSMLRA